jgi:hypothetical protein
MILFVYFLNILLIKRMVGNFPVELRKLVVILAGSVDKLILTDFIHYQVVQDRCISYNSAIDGLGIGQVYFQNRSKL